MSEEKAPCCTCGGYRIRVEREGGSVTIRAERENAGEGGASPCVVVCRPESASGEAGSPREIVIRCETGPRDSDSRACC